MKMWTTIIALMLVTVISTPADAQLFGKKPKKPEAAETDKRPAEVLPKFKLTEDMLYFTEPYIFLEPPIRNMIGMCLELDYAEIKYPFGFINTVDSKEPLISFKKRVPVNDEEQLKKLTDKSGLKVGDYFTVVSVTGNAYKASIAGFSYVGNSPSTVVVMADLKIEDPGPDKELFNYHAIALKGVYNIPRTEIGAGPAVPDDKQIKQKLHHYCAGNLPKGHVTMDPVVKPARLNNNLEEYFFVSFWHHPDPDFEIDDIKLAACMFKPSGDTWAKSELPLAFKLLNVYDLDQDGKGEIFAVTGDGLGICYSYLVPKGDNYKMLKEGMCAGY
jgi:hypothetical protein